MIETPLESALYIVGMLYVGWTKRNGPFLWVWPSACLASNGQSSRLWSHFSRRQNSVCQVSVAEQRFKSTELVLMANGIYFHKRVGCVSHQALIMERYSLRETSPFPRVLPAFDSSWHSAGVSILPFPLVSSSPSEYETFVSSSAT